MSIKKLNLSGHDNSILDEQGFETHKLHVDLSDPALVEKLQRFLLEDVGITSEDQVIMAAPGLAPLALLVTTIIHGITGQLPTIIPMIRNEEGQFVPGEGLELQNIRNDSVRVKRKGLTVL